MTVEKKLKWTLHFRSFLAHPHITKDMRFEPCRLSTQIAPVGRNFSYRETLATR